MKIPDKCVICNGILLNEFVKNLDRQDMLRQICCETLSHKFICYSYETSQIINSINLSYKNLSVVWFLDRNEIYVKNMMATTPMKCLATYIEPDFTDVSKLINKIKVCILFS